MAFQPLGYRFEITSALSLGEAKRRIRREKMGWFDSKNGARGWIIGPFLCLWQSAFDRHGPMVLGFIRHDGIKTKIVGRAGADLNGTALFLFLTPLMAWLTFQMARYGRGSTGSYVVIGLLFGIGLPLTLWINSKDRREADALVHFVRRQLAPTDKNVRSSAHSSPTQSRSVRLIVNGIDRTQVSADELHGAIAALSIGDFAVLERASEDYMQVLSKESEFILEKREGSAGRHFQAILPKSDFDQYQEYDDSLAQITAVMTAYLHRRISSSEPNWIRITP